MKTYRIKLTTLSPVHVGLGEDYEPTNFIIDSGTLYEFDEVALYQRLSPDEKRQFNSVVSQNTPDMLFKVHAFVKRHTKAAIAAAINRVEVSGGIAADYEAKIGRMVQQEGRGRGDTRKVFNQFQIMRTQYLPNIGMPYIPGSSLKGAISTAFQEMLYKNNQKQWSTWFKELRNPTLSPMKNLLISDLQPVECSASIGFAINKERFEDDEGGPSTKLEAIRPQSMFVGTISFKGLDPELAYDFGDFARDCNAHYKKNFDSLFVADEYIGRRLQSSFVQMSKSLRLDEKCFLVRIGRHSGARAVTIEGQRKIKVKISGGGRNRKPNVWEDLSEESTTWLFAGDEHQSKELMPFGWVLCELIDESTYQSLSAVQQEYRNAKEKEVSVRLAEQRAAAEAEREAARQKEEARREEEARKKAQKEAREAQLAAMSPADRLLEEKEIPDIVNMMKTGEIEGYEAIKIELAQKIKVELQKDLKKWDNAKQKALKRKEFIQEILGEK
jgi:CRISPR-associated protein Csm5